MDDRAGDLGRTVWFMGNLDDPWVRLIADALPPGTNHVACPGDLPPLPLGGDTEEFPGVLVLHRAVLTRHDAEVLTRLRASRTPPPRVVLCPGPHVRHVDLERWADLFDAVVPEATARDTIARYVQFPERHPEAPATREPRMPVAIVSANAAMRQMLAEGCEAAGYPVLAMARGWSEVPESGLAVWDVPVLEPGWPQSLERRASVGPVIALFGFADRGLVTEARDRGASACLEIPFDLADLENALDRSMMGLNAPSRHSVEPPHPVPPPPAARRRNVAPRVVVDTDPDA